MAWWHLRRSLSSFFQVNPEKILRGFPGSRFARLSVRLSVLFVVCVKYQGIIHSWSCFTTVFAQELNKIMAWWQLRRSLSSFFLVNPGKKLRGFPCCRQAMILFSWRGGMGVTHACCSRFARLSVRLSVLFVVCVKYQGI